MPADKIRNVALVGHRGSGKTSLNEALLYEAGAINRLGSVVDGTTVSDSAPDEKARQMSISASLSSFRWQDRKINLIDTPGEPSFVAEALAALRVCEGAVFVVNGVMGAEVSTDRLWQRAEQLGLARVLFVNMLDRERADFFRALDSLKAAFGPHVVATEIPLGAEHELEGVVDLIDMKASRYESAGRGNASEVEIPDDLRAPAEEYREKLMDEVAEVSDELMERYLEGEEVGQLLVPQGKETDHAEEFGPGDIGAVAKLKETHAGDVLASSEIDCRLSLPEMPRPVMAFAMEPKAKGDEEKVSTALRRLQEEDPTIDVHRDPQTGELIVAGLTQVHVEVVVARMKDRYGAEVSLKPPRVPYREAIKGTAKAHARYKKQTGGRGQFADVHIEIDPLPQGTEFEFENAIKGGVIPGGFIPAVEKGVQEAMQAG